MMKSCFLFGHGDCPESILPKIEAAVEACYSCHGIAAFYVGNRGRFDRLAATAVKRAKQRHPDICLYLLLAYHPAERPVDLQSCFDGSFYPPLEDTPRQYTIVKANRYMVRTADALICYVCHPGNTRKLLQFARRQQKERGIPLNNLASHD